MESGRCERVRRWGVGVVLAWGLLGCGDAARGGSAPEPEPEPEPERCGAAPWALTPERSAETAACLEQTWVAPIAAAECERLVACGCPNEAALEGCEARRSARARRLLEAAQEAEAAGGLWLNPAALARCRSGVIAGLEAGCGLPTLSAATEQACAQVFASEEGLAAPVPGPDEEVPPPARTPEGGACEATEACEAGLVCEAGRCAPLASSACSSEAAECGAEQVCVWVSGSRLCVEASLGEACSVSEGCPGGAWCVEGRCAASPGLGEPCADGIYCAEGLACRFEDGSCQAVPAEGEACALGLYGPFVCAEGLGCQCAAGELCRERSCQPLASAGEACAQDGRCAEGLGCVFGTDGTNTCAAPVGEGAECTNDTNCASGLYCDFSALACRPWAAFGEACRDGNECGPAGTCAPDGSGGFVCGPLPNKGEACFLECAGRGVCEAVDVVAACAPVICEVLAR